jgi:uncharacterized protein (UPF0332 family)
MELTRDEKAALSNLRFQKSKEMFEDALFNLKSERFKTSANRSYYSVYHAARSLLILKGIDPAKHDGVKTMFSLHFVKDKTVTLETGKIYHELMSLRNEADYDDFAEVTEPEAKRAVKIAGKFIKNIDKLRQLLIKDRAGINNK